MFLDGFWEPNLGIRGEHLHQWTQGTWKCPENMIGFLPSNCPVATDGYSIT